ncbi:MAG: NAD(P)-dependent oxidoreductase [Halobacteriaceae archaeon]
MTWNVLAGRPPHPDARPAYDGWADVTVATDYDSQAALDDDLGRFDAVVLGGLEFPAERLDRAANLTALTSPGVGLDAVDVEAATARGVVVCHVRGANTRAVAEYTVTAMLALRRELRRADRDVRNGVWEKFGYTNSEVAGQVMGVFGYGAIGSLVADLARGLDMDVVAYDPYVEDAAFPDGVDPVESKHDLFERADAVGIHAPLTEETRGAVGAAELRALGADGVLVNASRGPVVDTDALVAALRTDAIHGAAVDVFDAEPAPADHPLFDLENALVTPHMAGSTRASVPAKHRGAASNLRAVYEGSVPDTAVNRDELCLRAAYGGDRPVGDVDEF